jgi:energy-coupling factor transporter ATP-binding protein EcfA2
MTDSNAAPNAGPEYSPWAREVLRFLGVKTQFVLWGNVHDIFLCPKSGAAVWRTLPEYLMELSVAAQVPNVIRFDCVDGFRIMAGDPHVLAPYLSGLDAEGHKPFQTLGAAGETIQSLLPRSPTGSTAGGSSEPPKSLPVTVILDLASRYVVRAEEPRSPDEAAFYTRLFKLAYDVNTSPREGRTVTVFWLVDRLNDVPGWMTLENTRLKTIGVPKPDIAVRTAAAASLMGQLHDSNAVGDRLRDKMAQVFVSQTERMCTRDMKDIVRFMDKEHRGVGQLEEAVKSYKLGVTDDQWAKLRREDLQNGAEKLGERVKGQPVAIAKSLDIIRRAYAGLSGAQYGSSSNRPKGVLFFAGPTGVGKTELAKAITALVFGNEQHYIRFDMSEFNHEHADQRLIGAPPGYVGYESGGELTNAVRQNPFSVILFDEIEKAHPRILDKFLQILDDGRLTDGRGDTVYFSESLIIFTSNLGARQTTGASGGPSQGSQEPRAMGHDIPDYGTLESSIQAAISDFFTTKLERPEILNRLGQNIVVFDFIRQGAAAQILAKMLKTVGDRIKELHHVSIELDEEPMHALEVACTADLSMGGRGIGNQLEVAYVNPLARALFELQPAADSTVRVVGITKEDEQWSLEAVTDGGGHEQ